MANKNSLYSPVKNQEMDVIIEDLTHEGLGVAKVNGYPLFLPDALPTERVRARIVRPLTMLSPKWLNAIQPPTVALRLVPN